MTTNVPSTRDEFYAKAYPGWTDAQIATEHGGPQTQKGGAHAPVLFRNYGGTFTATGCMCGDRPKTPPQSPRSTATAYQAHVRRLGLPRISNFSHAVYAYGEGYPAEGLTYNEWAALGAEGHPFGSLD